MENQRFVNGSTLLGVALALFALRNTSGQINWQYWIMIIAAVFYIVSALREYWFRR